MTFTQPSTSLTWGTWQSKGKAAPKGAVLSCLIYKGPEATPGWWGGHIHQMFFYYFSCRLCSPDSNVLNLHHACDSSSNPCCTDKTSMASTHCRCIPSTLGLWAAGQRPAGYPGQCHLVPCLGDLA